MPDEIQDGVPIEHLSLGMLVWLLQGLEHIWDIPPEHLPHAAKCIERLRLELAVRTMTQH